MPAPVIWHKNACFGPNSIEFGPKEAQNRQKGLFSEKLNGPGRGWGQIGAEALIAPDLLPVQASLVALQ
jgi:hypothetical protein